MPLTRRLTQVTQVRESLPDDEVKAVKWLQQAEAILICAGDIFTSEADAGIFRPSPLTARGGLEHGIPAQGSWTPVCALWREHLQLDSARLFESDAALAWAYWGFWCKCYLEEAPNDFYRYLGTWACSRSQGCFCVTEGISGHWARTLGEESIWETRGSVSHLQRVDGCDKVWRVGETRMSLTTQRRARWSQHSHVCPDVSLGQFQVKVSHIRFVKAQDQARRHTRLKAKPNTKQPELQTD